MKKYLAYGLVFQSDINLKPLTPVSDDIPHQVVIRCTDVPESGLKVAAVRRGLAQIGDNEVWVNIPDIARMQISDGKEIRVQPCDNADEQSIRLYVMGSAIGAILHQRGFLVLHANAIKVGEGAVLFAGISGAGKSTTAAVFHQQGYPVISDDVVAVDAAGNVVGGFPQIKLWEDTLESLEIPREPLSRIRLEIKKYSFPLPQNVEQSLLPIRAIYTLASANENQPDQFDFTVLEGIAKFNHLKAHTYRRHFMEGMGLRPRHLRLCSALAGKVHMARLIRPTAHFNAPQLVERVFEDLSESGILTSS